MSSYIVKNRAIYIKAEGGDGEDGQLVLVRKIEDNELTHEETCLLKHLWSPDEEKTSLLTEYSCVQTTVANFLSKHSIDKAGNERLKLTPEGKRVELTYLNTNLFRIQNYLKPTDSLLVSIRIFTPAAFYFGLVRKNTRRNTDNIPSLWEEDGDFYDPRNYRRIYNARRVALSNKREEKEEERG